MTEQILRDFGYVWNGYPSGLWAISAALVGAVCLGALGIFGGHWLFSGTWFRRKPKAHTNLIRCRDCGQLYEGDDLVRHYQPRPFAASKCEASRIAKLMVEQVSASPDCKVSFKLDTDSYTAWRRDCLLSAEGELSDEDFLNRWRGKAPKRAEYEDHETHVKLYAQNAKNYAFGFTTISDAEREVLKKYDPLSLVPWKRKSANQPLCDNPTCPECRVPPVSPPGEHGGVKYLHLYPGFCNACKKQIT